MREHHRYFRCSAKVSEAATGSLRRFCTLLFLGGALFRPLFLTAQEPCRTSVSWNLPPLFRTVVEGGVEHTLSPSLGCELYGVWMRNDHDAVRMFDPGVFRRKGVSLKSALRFHPRSSYHHTAFLFMVGVLTAFLDEEIVEVNPFFPGPVNHLDMTRKKSLSTGGSIFAGLTTSSSRRVALDAGVLVGVLFSNSMLKPDGYVPGFGRLHENGSYVQLIARLKLRIFSSRW